MSTTGEGNNYVKQRTTAAMAALTLSSALALTACGNGEDTSTAEDDKSTEAVCTVAADQAQDATPEPLPTAGKKAQKALEAITIDGDPGKEPQGVTVDSPVDLGDGAEPVVAIHVIDKGDGNKLVDGEQAVIQDYVVNGKNGKKVASSWEDGGVDPITIGDPGSILTEPLKGLNAGARLAIAIPAADEEGKPVSNIHVVDVLETKPARAQGKPVEPAEGLPAVELADDGTPTVTIPAGYEKPTELVAQTLIEGDGEKVAEGAMVTVQYLGCLTDGTSFDSSWSRGTPLVNSLDQLVEGWKKGLVGQKVGSQVLLVVPSELGYKDQEVPNIPPGSTLIFVVDILDTQNAVG